MNAFGAEQTNGQVVTPERDAADVLEAAGMNYCRDATKSLDDACREKVLGPAAVAAQLAKGGRVRSQGLDTSSAIDVDVEGLSLTELVNHIEKTHHAYLLEELPRLAGIVRDVASQYGAKDGRLKQLEQTYLCMAVELWGHMLKEEQCLFPMIKDLEISNHGPPSHCGTIANPIQRMVTEHDDANSALEELRALTDGFLPPTWACTTYRALLEALLRLEQDMCIHIHKENDVLFPRALELEASRRHGSAKT
jgi:regulator of cell morphogenesis and NO signaling